jgi:hypothetical protein
MAFNLSSPFAYTLPEMKRVASTQKEMSRGTLILRKILFHLHPLQPTVSGAAVCALTRIFCTGNVSRAKTIVNQSPLTCRTHVLAQCLQSPLCPPFQQHRKVLDHHPMSRKMVSATLLKLPRGQLSDKATLV